MDASVIEAGKQFAEAFGKTATKFNAVSDDFQK